MLLLGFISPMICITLITSSLIKLTKKSFGNCIPITMIGLPLIVLFSYYIFKNLMIGIYIIYVLVLASIVMLFINIKDREYRQHLFSVGFFVFIFIYCFVYIITRKAYFFAWDEFSHWGPMINEMMKTNKIYINNFHASYPPLVQLFEYTLIKFGLAFEEFNLKFIVHLFNFSIVCVPISEIFNQQKDKIIVNILKGIGMFFIVFLLALGIDAYGSFMTIYLDVSVGVFFAYLIYLIQSDSDKWMIAIASFSFILVKDISILFVSFLLMYIFIDFIINIRTSTDKKIIQKETLKKALIIIVPSIVSYALWHIHKISAGLLNDQFAIKNFSVNKFFNMFLNKLSENQLSTFNAYFKSLIFTNLADSPFPLTYVSSLIIILTILIIFMLSVKEKEERLNYIKVILLVVATYVIYMLFMLNTYVNIFEGEESATLASYKRYMSSYVLGIYICVMIFLYNNTHLKNILVSVFSILAIVLSVYALREISIDENNAFNDMIKYERNIYKQLTNNVKNYDKCIVVMNKIYDSDMIKDYYNVNRVAIDLFDVKKLQKEGAESLIDILKDYDYISLIDYQGDIYQIYSSEINKYFKENSIDDEYNLSLLKGNKIMPLK